MPVNAMEGLRNWWRRYEDWKPRRVRQLLVLAALEDAAAQERQQEEQDGTGNAGSAA